MTGNKTSVHAIEPRGDLLHQHSISATYSAVGIEPGIPFWILIASFGEKKYRLPKGKILALLKALGLPTTRLLNDGLHNYSEPEKECITIVFAVKTARPYLQCEEFTVFND